MLFRLLISAAIAIPCAFAADQQPVLPNPMSSAIHRIAQGQTAPSVPKIVLPRPLSAKACSIPLLEAKAPAKTWFSIRALPVPTAKRVDRMPVLNAPVCGAPTQPGH